MTDEAIVRITYIDSPKLEKKINKALKECPEIKEETECLEFK